MSRRSEMCFKNRPSKVSTYNNAAYVNNSRHLLGGQVRHTFYNVTENGHNHWTRNGLRPSDETIIPY